MFVRTWFFGEARLWKPYWLGGLLGTFLISIIGAPLQLAGVIGSIIASLLGVIYMVWLGVAIWNCAYNVEWEWWGHIARAYVICMVALIIGFGVFFVLLV